MKILSLQNNATVLDKKQLSYIKGGNDNTSSSDIIVITDDDII